MAYSLKRWEGKVAIVTGASSGVGAALAEKLVEHGLLVVGFARRSELIENLAQKLKHQKGKLYACKADMSKEEDIIKAFQWVSKNVGPVHILVNNAGDVQVTNLIDGDADKWWSVFNVNVLAISIATREAIKIMRKNKIDGHIVHINAILGHRVIDIPGLNVYPASKFATTALTETLRQELTRLGLKIKISSVSPGRLSTEFGRNTSKFQDEIRITSPSLKPEDVAETVIFALSTPPDVQIHEIMMQATGEKF